jgi:hypothetical protein
LIQQRGVTFAQLAHQLEAQFGCTVRRLAGYEHPPVFEINRELEGELLYTVLAVEFDDWPLEKPVIRSIFTRLKLPVPEGWDW